MSGIILEKPSILGRQADDSLVDRQHLFVISDESQDSYDTVFKASSWDLTHRMKGKKRVTYGHPSVASLEPDHIIGIGEERLEGNSLLSVLTLEPETLGNRIANAVHGKLGFGSLTDASIRARVTDGRMGDETLGEDPTLFYFTRSILIDWGVVMEGSNPNAVKQRSDLADFIKTKVPTNYQREIQFLESIGDQVLHHVILIYSFIKFSDNDTISGAFSSTDSKKCRAANGPDHKYSKVTLA